MVGSNRLRSQANRFEGGPGDRLLTIRAKTVPGMAASAVRAPAITMV
jgi:hypothetical protein